LKKISWTRWIGAGVESTRANKDEDLDLTFDCTPSSTEAKLIISSGYAGWKHFYSRGCDCGLLFLTQGTEQYEAYNERPPLHQRRRDNVEYSFSHLLFSLTNHFSGRDCFSTKTKIYPKYFRTVFFIAGD